MAPHNAAKSLMKDIRASFRKKKHVEKTSAPPIVDKILEKEEEELAKLAQFKDKLKGENLPARFTDAVLFGFLRVKGFDLNEAEKLLKLNYNLWRFVDMDHFMKTYELSGINAKYSSSGMIGTDKEGTLVRVINLGSSDIRGFLSCISTINNLMYFIWYTIKDLEMQEEEDKRRGKIVPSHRHHKVSYIFDLEGLNMHQLMFKPALDTAIGSLNLMQEHFNDFIKVAYFVNAPRYFMPALKILKAGIDEDVFNRAKFFDSCETKEELLKVIDADVLPEYLGGNRRDDDGDISCKSIIGQGGTIPEQLYCSDWLVADDPEVTTITVPAGCYVNFRYKCPEIGTLITWHIQSKENDVGICVLLDHSEDSENKPEMSVHKAKMRGKDMSDMEPLAPIVRSQCHLCAEKGSSISWFIGTVVFHIDNTYSWMCAKEVKFKVEILPPGHKRNPRPKV